MFHILAAVIIIASGETGTFVSNQGYPSMAICEAALPDGERQFRDMLRGHGLGENDVRVKVICEFMGREQLKGHNI